MDVEKNESQILIAAKDGMPRLIYDFELQRTITGKDQEKFMLFTGLLTALKTFSENLRIDFDKLFLILYDKNEKKLKMKSVFHSKSIGEFDFYTLSLINEFSDDMPKFLIGENTRGKEKINLIEKLPKDNQIVNSLDSLGNIADAYGLKDQCFLFQRSEIMGIPKPFVKIYNDNEKNEGFYGFCQAIISAIEDFFGITNVNLILKLKEKNEFYLVSNFANNLIIALSEKNNEFKVDDELKKNIIDSFNNENLYELFNLPIGNDKDKKKSEFEKSFLINCLGEIHQDYQLLIMKAISTLKLKA